MKFLAILLPVFASVALATPANSEKRQFMIPPDDCDNENEWFTCASRNPTACLGHPVSQILCYELCGPCCDGREAEGCVAGA